MFYVYVGGEICGGGGGEKDPRVFRAYGAGVWVTRLPNAMACRRTTFLSPYAAGRRAHRNSDSIRARCVAWGLLLWMFYGGGGEGAMASLGAPGCCCVWGIGGLPGLQWAVYCW